MRAEELRRAQRLARQEAFRLALDDAKHKDRAYDAKPVRSCGLADKVKAQAESVVITARHRQRVRCGSGWHWIEIGEHGDGSIAYVETPCNHAVADGLRLLGAPSCWSAIRDLKILLSVHTEMIGQAPVDPDVPARRLPVDVLPLALRAPAVNARALAFRTRDVFRTHVEKPVRSPLLVLYERYVRRICARERSMAVSLTCKRTGNGSLALCMKECAIMERNSEGYWRALPAPGSFGMSGNRCYVCKEHRNKLWDRPQRHMMGAPHAASVESFQLWLERKLNALVDRSRKEGRR